MNRRAALKLQTSGYFTQEIAKPLQREPSDRKETLLIRFGADGIRNVTQVL